MGYKRLVSYGCNVELYEYAKDFEYRGGTKRTSKKRVVSDCVDESGVSSFSAQSERLGKRRDHARRACMAFRRLVLANLGTSESPLLLTLTYKNNEISLRKGYQDFTSFIHALRRKYGKVWKYIAVPEFQVRGAVHFHALVWGLRFEQIGRLVPYEQVGIYNVINTPFWKHGVAFLKETDGHEKLSSYLVKYMAKAFVSAELYNQKAFVSSRNCTRPVSVGGAVAVDWLFDDYVVAGSVPFDQCVYETSFLGQCKKSSFYVSIELQSSLKDVVVDYPQVALDDDLPW